MRKRTTRSLLVHAVLAATVLGTVAGPIGITHASDDSGAIGASAVPVAVATTTTVLPLFGAPLTVTVTTGADGALHEVSVDPADGFTAVADAPHRVAFVNDDGTAKVVVKSREGGQRVEAKAGSMADLSGPGSWSGEVFPGKVANVTFQLGMTADGGPDITNLASDFGTPMPTEYSSNDDHDDEALIARARVQFIDGTQTRWLSIKASISHDDDGNEVAKVRVSLSRIKGLALPAETVVGPQHWQGPLCDGTTATIDYVLAADGTISGVAVTPSSARFETGEHEIVVRFATGEKVRVKVNTEDGMRKIMVQTKIRCDRVEPTVTPGTVPGTAGEDGDRGRSHGDEPHPSTTTGGSAPTSTEHPTTTIHGGSDSSTTLAVTTTSGI